jgi:hypothetical protein
MQKPGAKPGEAKHTETKPASTPVTAPAAAAVATPAPVTAR